VLDDRDFNGLATFADPVRAQGVIDRFTSNAYDLVIEGSPHVVMPQPWTFSNMALTAP
jgi:hypothetical protein